MDAMLRDIKGMADKMSNRYSYLLTGSIQCSNSLFYCLDFGLLLGLHGTPNFFQTLRLGDVMFFFALVIILLVVGLNTKVSSCVLLCRT